MGSSDGVTRFVTTVMGIVIGLTFLFGFGNVLALALRIGVPAYVAPLVAPALDMTVLGLLVGTRHLAMSGASDPVLRPARRLLLAASAATLALNIADPICSGQWGKAGIDAVGPLLLIGWAEVGPALLRSLQSINDVEEEQVDEASSAVEHASGLEGLVAHKPKLLAESAAASIQAKLECARNLNRDHWNRHRRPISAETLRRELSVSSATSRRLCATVRSEMQPS